MKKFRYTIFISGLLLSVATALSGHADSAELLMFQIRLSVWAIMPYLIFLLVSSKLKNNPAVIGAGVLMLGLDFIAHVSLLFSPGSSTDGIAFLFIPFWLIVLIMPVGFVLGWGTGTILQRIKQPPTDNKKQ